MEAPQNDNPSLETDALIQGFLEDALSEEEAAELWNCLQDDPGLIEGIERHREVDFLLQLLDGIKNEAVKRSLEEDDQEEPSGFPPTIKNLWSRYSGTLARETSSRNFDWDQLARLCAGAAGDSLDSEQLRELAGLIAEAAETTSLDQENVQRPVRSRSYERKPVVFSFSHLALLVILIVTGFFAVYSEFFRVEPASVAPPSRPFHAIGTISAAVDVQWTGESDALKPGQGFESRRIAFRSGLVELTLKNDVRLALEGPIDLQLQSSGSVFCSGGRLSATVGPAGHGFEVVTPLYTLTDLGTEFTMQVDKERVQTHTLTGKVELSRLPEGKADLVEGRAFSIDSQGKSLHFDADPLVFVSQRDVLRRVVETDKIALERWREQSAVWNDDPGLLVRFDFEGKGKRIDNVAQRAPRTVSNALLNGVGRTQGRWHGKSAVDFRKKRNSVDFSLADELPSFTLFVSARIDSLSRFNHTLLSSTLPEKGGIVWQLWNDGSIQLSVYETPGSPLRRFNAPGAVRPEHCGAWSTIATVLDNKNKMVRHYFDGRKTAEIPIASEIFVQIGKATLGNALIEEKKTTDRSFDGAMDEFMLFNRALTDDEIISLHSLGQ